MKNHIVAVYVACTLGLTGCNYTNTYTPELKCRTDDIANSLHDPYDFDDVDLSAKSTIGTNGKHDKLIIRLINGHNIPQDYKTDASLAINLLKRILPEVVDTAQYDSYEVVFVTTKTIDSNTQTNETAIDLDK